MAMVSMTLAAMAVTALIVLFLAWEMASEVSFISTVPTPIYPEPVVDSATAPVTTTGR